jgi:hypothetical protein
VDSVVFAEFALETRHELAVPAIVNAFASSLNEEDLLSHGEILFDGTGGCKAARLSVGGAKKLRAKRDFQNGEVTGWRPYRADATKLDPAATASGQTIISGQRTLVSQRRDRDRAVEIFAREGENTFG